jgi:hypothetical protein
VGGQRHDLGLARPAREDAGDPPLAHDHDAVAHADHLEQLGRDHDHGHALARGLADQVVDRGLAVDVDAAGRLVEDQQVLGGGEPLGQHDLLLVAAREELHLLVQAGGAQVDRVVSSRTEGWPFAAVSAEPREQRAQRAVGEHHVVGDRLAQRQPLALAVLGDEAHPARTASRGERGGRAAVQPDLARVKGSAPNSARASSVRPAPWRPAMPSTSPARTSRSMSCSAALPPPLTRSTTSPSSSGGRGRGSSRPGRDPTIIRTSSPV